jgi:hypothetical protein
MQKIINICVCVCVERLERCRYEDYDGDYYIRMDFMEIDNGRWLKLPHDIVQWQT